MEALATSPRNKAVVHEGYLTKRAMKSGRNWKRRYFVLKDHAMIYYDEQPTFGNDKSMKPKGLVEITAKSVVRASPVNKAFAFELLSRPQLLCVHADSKEQADKWMAALQNVIKSLRKAQTKPRQEESRRGWLIKRAIKSGRNWKKRFFVLRNGRLSYYEQPPSGASDRPKGMMELTAGSVVRESASSLGFSKKHGFHVQSEYMTLYVSADTNEERSEWIHSIYLSILRKANITKDSAIRVAIWMREQGLQQYVQPVIVDGGFDSFDSLRSMSEEDQKALLRHGRFSMNDAKTFSASLRHVNRLDAKELEQLYKPSGPSSAVGSAKLMENKTHTTDDDETDDDVPPPPPSTFDGTKAGDEKISHFDRKSVASLERRLYSWGDDSELQLGIGSTTAGMCSEPSHVESLKNRTEPLRVYAGHTCMAAITKKTGELFTWGAGPIGLGPVRVTSNRPYLVTPLRKKRVIEVAIGSTHMGCVTEDGEAFTWGKGKKGQLGHGRDMKELFDPRLLETVMDVPMKSIKASREHTILLARDGKVFVMGNGKYGRLGLGDEGNQYYPSCLESLNGQSITKIACGDDFSLALCRNRRSCFWWGRLAENQGPYVPVRLEPFDERYIDEIEAAGEVAAFIVGLRPGNDDDAESGEEDADVVPSSVYTIGTNGLLLGHGSEEPCNVPTLVQALEGHGVIQISVSQTHVGALCEDGRLLMWGEDERGQLGNGYLVTIARPHCAIGIAGYRYVQVTCGVSSTMVVAEFDPQYAQEIELHGDEAKPYGETLSPPPPPEETVEKQERDQKKFKEMMQKLSKITTLIDDEDGEHGGDSMNDGGRGQEQDENADHLPAGTVRYMRNWLRHTDRSTGNYYYENVETGQVQWTDPHV